MILDTLKLKSWVDDITFARAKKYYKGGFVEELKIDSKNLPGSSKIETMTIKSRVISLNGFNTHDVKIEWDGILNKLIVSCDCYNNEGNISNMPCRHITAVLLKYINEYQDKIYKGSQIDEVDSLISQLREASKENNDYKRELNLKIKFFNEEYSRPHIQLKLGVEKIYVVKNMRKFLYSVLNRTPLEFGKNFSYDPAIHKFNKTDEKIMNMFLELKELDNYDVNEYGYYDYSNSIFSGKDLFLTDTLIDRFFNLAKERNIDAAIYEKEYTDVKIIKGEIPLKFKIGINGQHIELSQENEIPVPIDSLNKVYFYEGSFYLPPEKQIEMYQPIYNVLKSKRDKKLIINKNEGEKVASYLLPALKKVSNEVTLDKSIKDTFYEAELTVKTYLDKKDDFITAEIKFFYNDADISKGILIRDVQKEENCVKVLKSFGFEKDTHGYIMRNEKNIVSFIDAGINKLQELSEVYYSDSFKNIKLYGKSNIKSGIRLNHENLLEFTFELEGVDNKELKNIFNALKEKKKYYRLKKGGFVSLEDEGVKNVGEIIDYLDINNKDLIDGKMLLSKYNALYLDQKIKDKNMDFVKRSKDFRELTNNIRDVKEMEYDLPDGLDKIMREYQKVGFKWFKTLSYYGFGGILADEMGLGKTLEAIAFIDSEKGEKPSIVIAPTSLLYNWQNEIEKFVPELKTVVMSGSKKQRKELMDKIKYCDIVVTSYPLIRRDIDEYENMDFNYCILDEAQQIKNAASINASSVKKIKAKGYFALTGTPMENSLTELWSIFDFIMPGYLLSHNKFTKLYEIPIIKNNDKAALDELERHIKPFILRRLKKDVTAELPPKIEHELVIEMTEEQKKIYAAYLNSAREEISGEISKKGFNKSKIKIFAVLTRLRQICCDPSVFIENFKGQSGKMIALNEILHESIDQGHKILLFSQFTSVLKNISEMLDKNKFKYLYLDGSTKSENRITMCKEFNNGNASIFLISLKAGGTGLNLTGADTVIHFDPWWNPAVEEQATDRAHRIGQKKTVEVIKLLSKGTIEEKIFSLQKKKKEIIDNVINEDMNPDNVMIKMTQEELENLFT